MDAVSLPTVGRECCYICKSLNARKIKHAESFIINWCLGKSASYILATRVSYLYTIYTKIKLPANIINGENQCCWSFFVYRDVYLSCLSRDVQNVTSQGLSVVLIPPLSSFIRFILEKSCDVIGLSCSDSRLRKVAAFSGVSVIVPCSALSVNSDYRRNFKVIIHVSNLN